MLDTWQHRADGADEGADEQSRWSQELPASWVVAIVCAEWKLLMHHAELLTAMHIAVPANAYGPPRPEPPQADQKSLLLLLLLLPTLTSSSFSSISFAKSASDRAGFLSRRRLKLYLHMVRTHNVR
jgi:hypothetical protein